MFFFRTTLLLGLGVLVLPTDEASQARLYSSAKTAMNWTTTFCDRNAGTCAQSRELWAVFVKKAEFGAKMAYDLISERNAQTAAAPAAAPVKAMPNQPGVVLPARGTLKPSDLEPAWRGKIARAGA